MLQGAVQSPGCSRYALNPVATGTARAAQGTRAAAENNVKIFIGLIVVVLLGLAGFTWFTLHWTYAEGERAGYVQKFSRKGWMCKTWEGEMAMVTMPGTVAEKFSFTVPDDAVAAQVNAQIGKRVSLAYKERKWIPSSCFGETSYFVYGVRLAEPPAGVQ
jgi:hypothetical protein